MSETYQGSCLCAAIRYELLARPKAVTHCHCSQCRKGHGAAFASYASVPRSALRLHSGAEALKAYPSSTDVLRQFCTHCGTSLFWSRSQGPFSDWVSVTLGTLDTPFVPGKQQHTHLDCKAPWLTLSDVLPAG
ncbi:MULTISPECIES: GFA family protein [Pseudomonas]|uniref:GFA family protein n=1 Tax=Pseudomonas TaxID=286 RepID=UPI001E3F8084|nr:MULTISPECIES: GFA family protein [Pseudomonas]MCE1118736.1 GFA family protein [Pseudomonas sp. NMI795_08]